MTIRKDIGALAVAGMAAFGIANAQVTDPRTEALQSGVQSKANSLTVPPAMPPVQMKSNIGGVVVSGTTEFSKELGALVRAGVATRIGPNGAVYVEVSVGPKQKELFAQAGIEIGNNTIVTITYQNLEQYREFAFPSGVASENVNQQAFGMSARFHFDANVIKYLELQGYHIEAASKDLSDKEFTISAPGLFQILNDYRKLAGSNTDGLKLVIRLGTNDGKYTLDLETGAEVTKRLTMIATPSTTRITGGARAAYHPTPDSEIYVGAIQPAGSKVLGIAGYKDGIWNIGVNSANGGTVMAGIQVPFDAFFNAIKPAKKNGARSSGSQEVEVPTTSVSYNEWKSENPDWTPKQQSIGDEVRYNNEFFAENMAEKLGRMGILEAVQAKASWVPRTVAVTRDETAQPKELLTIVNPDGPGKSTDKITGDITLTEALGFGALISALNTSNGQTIPSNAYSLGSTTLIIHPRALESSLATGYNTIIIDTTLATTTLIVEKGSVKVHSTTVIRKAANTAPVANPDSITTVKNTAKTFSPLANDTDAENNTLSIGSYTQGAHGTVTQSGNNLIYTPVAGYIGADSFSYLTYDGTSNSLTPATVSVTINAPSNVVGTIAIPSLENKSTTTVNTAPGAVTGMSNVRVEAYSDVGLTTLVATQASGDFSGLLASTTYYFVTVGDDVNENTGATETKRSATALSVTTDALPVLPSCTTTIDDQGWPWGTGASMILNISSCTAGSTWTVEDITPTGTEPANIHNSGPALVWFSPVSGSGDASLTFQIDGATESRTITLRVTVTKGGQAQQYIHTAPYPIL